MEIEIGDYKVVINLNARYSKTVSATVIGYAFNYVITRIDGKPVIGSDLTVPSGECESINGPYPTREIAYSAAQAAAEHNILQFRRLDRD